MKKLKLGVIGAGRIGERFILQHSFKVFLMLL